MDPTSTHKSVTRHTMTARQLERDREYAIIDTRPFEERYGDLGFIPGSLSVPFERDRPDMAVLEDCIKREGRVALVCLSGRRTHALVESMVDGPYADRISHLEHGMLGWSENDLPVCGLDDDVSNVPEFKALSEFPRVLASCFVAELVELSLDHGDDLDPYALLQQCFEHERVRWEQPDAPGLYRVLDRAAYLSRHMGNSMVRVRDNVDRFHAALRRFESGPRLA